MILLASGKPNVEEEFQRLARGAKADIQRDGIFWDSDEHVLFAQKKIAMGAMNTLKTPLPTGG
ncbi:hypothetical protein EYZ11_013277 [Aspergillus tanneri]|uniref:Uncharacterized protein n=1 Tax=Aspergillus tanneri TaxID=1220188 RepID=A0A4S3J099_9EURO|nr:hypothetical protein EYZ11_013277 [Aspergillus tanneri]